MVSKSEIKRVRAQSPAVDQKITELELERDALALALMTLRSYVERFVAQALKDIGEP